MEDTAWCMGSEGDMPVFGRNLQKARLLTKPFFWGPNQLLVVASCKGFELCTWVSLACQFIKGQDLSGWTSFSACLPQGR